MSKRHFQPTSNTYQLIIWEKDSVNPISLPDSDGLAVHDILQANNPHYLWKVYSSQLRHSRKHPEHGLVAGFTLAQIDPSKDVFAEPLHLIREQKGA